MKDTTEGVRRFYARNDESSRLSKPSGELEFSRTKSIIERYAEPGAVIVDVGGGSGPYSLWLAAKGHEVHLVEPAANLLDEARQLSVLQPLPIKAFHEADTRGLPLPENFADIVLMFGPLYHLQTREQRLQALKEAARVLKPGGTLLAVGISRFASLLDGFRKSYFDDPQFFRGVIECLDSGFHSNPTNNPAYFTDAYFHRPEELEAELTDTGFRLIETLGVEGPAWLFPSLSAYLADEKTRRQTLELLEQIEHERSVIGASAHILVVGAKARINPK